MTLTYPFYWRYQCSRYCSSTVYWYISLLFTVLKIYFEINKGSIMIMIVYEVYSTSCENFNTWAMPKIIIFSYIYIYNLCFDHWYYHPFVLSCLIDILHLYHLKNIRSLLKIFLLIQYILFLFFLLLHFINNIFLWCVIHTFFLLQPRYVAAL